VIKVLQRAGFRNIKRQKVIRQQLMCPQERLSRWLRQQAELFPSWNASR
jgi:hypothetical protein